MPHPLTSAGMLRYLRWGLEEPHPPVVRLTALAYLRTLVSMTGVVVALASCGTDDAAQRARSTASASTAGDVATWVLLDPEDVSEDSETLRLGVTRLGWSGGDTGVVLEPAVTLEQDRIVIRTEVEPLPAGGYDCPGNDVVPVLVHLGEPIGPRELVDAACLDGEAVGTAACLDGPVRWPAPA